ncbi:hypothetical protein ANN_09618 [Periplaneta americana]|uniref:Uncharacterized protein n=1 Tax=Periplaneta americana TaxID=6978 RepID=A0ABQ8TLS7_PERAM|nr:hypothetical protein ANN_09618 [Periplaneta americana]
MTAIQTDAPEEQRLRVFENKVLRKIFGAKRDEATGEWRKLHNTELHALFSSPDIIRNIKSRRLRWEAGGKRPLGRPRCRWEDNIKMDLREVGYDDRDWINLAQDRHQWRAYVRLGAIGTCETDYSTAKWVEAKSNQRRSKVGSPLERAQGTSRFRHPWCRVTLKLEEDVISHLRVASPESGPKAFPSIPSGVRGLKEGGGYSEEELESRFHEQIEVLWMISSPARTAPDLSQHRNSEDTVLAGDP